MSERNADVSKTLTDKWNKGELPEGWYWCECYNEETKILYCDGDCFELDDPETKNYYFFSKEDSAEISILEKVPSYDEYQKLLSDQLAKNEGEEINAELERRLAMVKANGTYPDRISRLKSRVVALSEENDKLKELLKECAELMGDGTTYMHIDVYQQRKKDVMNAISQVLGEE